MSSKSFFSFKNGFSRKSSTPKSPPQIQSLQSSKSNSQAVVQPNIDEMRRVFNKFDKNKDGKISKEEYTLAVGLLGNKNAKSEVNKAFQAIDTDGDGFIDYGEFMEAQNSDGGVKTGDIKSAFKVFDLDGNGKITAEELVQVLRQLGEKCSLESCRKMVKGADSDGDGMIDINEFMGLMTRTMKLT
ncbi:calmodulin-like protein 30 [Rutidosis leptorrhynchoides]|uniref:calmodulin-like protein 30 n=1 Tax=Rutidosis leptorrhynchoides TaxID=125765 RepID=UPI003A9A5110